MLRLERCGVYRGKHMDSKKVERFMKLAGQSVAAQIDTRDDKTRKLGAQLLLSEVLEYVIRGLGVIPEVNGVPIENPEALTYTSVKEPDRTEMLDGLADVAYTMYWNQGAFGVPLEEAFELVCDNNLEKFVHLANWKRGEGALNKADWGCDRNVEWPAEVESVAVALVDGEFYAVGKDRNGKVRKPSTYRSVDLSHLLQA